ncbi:MAG: hypothetical protein QW390_04120 [Candidatus Bathyarchaeia archaeon]
MVEKADYGRSAFYLTLWMGLMDQERFQQFNLTHGEPLGRHLREKGVDEHFMVRFPMGRKANPQGFHTFIGKDALEAWRRYFEMERGYPKPGEAALLDEAGKPYRKKALYMAHLRLCRETLRLHGYEKGRSVRYGYNLHEFRDLAKTLLHIGAKGEGLDMACVEYRMGHRLRADPYGYDKFYADRGYMLQQYRIAERHLNIVSGAAAQSQAGVEKLRECYTLLERAFATLVQRLGERGLDVEATF